MKLKQYILLLSVLLAGHLLTGCTDWLDTQPQDKQSEEQQFANKEGFRAAVNGIYNRMSGGSLYGEYLSYTMLDLLGQCYAVEQNDGGSYYAYLRALTNWDYTDETVVAVLSSIWNEGYSTIMNINVILNNLEKDVNNRGALTEQEYKMLKGEMLAARAMIHFDLLRLFGPIYSRKPEGTGIPYNESTEVKILPILTAGTVLKDYILRDLKAAEALLLESDPVLTEGPRAEYDEVTLDNSMRYRQLRLNYYATVLLTARAYLWEGDLGNALTEARKLTDDPKVRQFFPAVDPATLLANSVDPDRMFSTEVLFGYYNKDRGEIYDYNFGGSNTAKRLLMPRSGYLDGQLYNGETSDYRRQSQWEAGETLEGNSSYQMVKFKEITENTGDITDTGSGNEEEELLKTRKFYGSFCSLIKLSEAYYIAAEALGTPEAPTYNAPEAWNYLNTIRADRGATAASGNDTKFRDVLTKEYIREFIGEGQIFFYFKRMNKGFDNDYNGRREVSVLKDPGFPPFIPPTYSYADDRSDAEKEADYVPPIPQSEYDNR